MAKTEDDWVRDHNSQFAEIAKWHPNEKARIEAGRTLVTAYTDAGLVHDLAGISEDEQYPGQVRTAAKESLTDAGRVRVNYVLKGHQYRELVRITKDERLPKRARQLARRYVGPLVEKLVDGIVGGTIFAEKKRLGRLINVASDESLPKKDRDYANEALVGLANRLAEKEHPGNEILEDLASIAFDRMLNPETCDAALRGMEKVGLAMIRDFLERAPMDHPDPLLEMAENRQMPETVRAAAREAIEPAILRYMNGMDTHAYYSETLTMIASNAGFGPQIREKAVENRRAMAIRLAEKFKIMCANPLAKDGETVSADKLAKRQIPEDASAPKPLSRSRSR
jgi:uncharacterized protein (UPF0147 family)